MNLNDVSGRELDRPNVVLILADDLGWADVGCYGARAIATPSIDRMAADGARFTHAYSASPWCSATRVALYTGRYPGRLPVGLGEPLSVRDEHSGIPEGHPTVPSLLRDSGYETAMFGKWHCGWLPWFSPLRIGFDTFFGNLGGALDYFEHIDSLGQPDLYEGETSVEETGYYTELLSNRAAEYVRGRSDKPFYLQLNYTAPHWPWEGPTDEATGQRIRSEFDSGDVSFPIMHLDGGSLAKYGELVEALDSGIGTVMEALDDATLSQNTIVIFSSDNGGERWSDNWPFVGEKGDLTEGGIRVPFILRWPNVVNPDQVLDEPTITMDWSRTLLAAAAAEPHPDYPLDGVDLLPWLMSEAEFPAHDLYWRTASQGAMRRGNLKYLRDLRDRAHTTNWPRFPGEYHLLYDVTIDGREAANIARHHPELLERMRANWDRFSEEQLPYPPDHRCLPRQAGDGLPAISQPD